MNLPYQPSQIAAISSLLGEKRASGYGRKFQSGEVNEPIITAPPEVRQIIDRVLLLEKEKMYQKIPRNIKDDILTIIKETIQQ